MEGGVGVDRAPWLEPPPPQKGSIDGPQNPTETQPCLQHVEGGGACSGPQSAHSAAGRWSPKDSIPRTFTCGRHGMPLSHRPQGWLGLQLQGEGGGGVDPKKRKRLN